MIIAMAFTIGSFMRPAAARTLIINIAQILFVKVNASAFNQYMPPVVSYKDIYGIVMQIPSQFVYFRRICWPGYNHGKIVTAI